MEAVCLNYEAQDFSQCCRLPCHLNFVKTKTGPESLTLVLGDDPGTGRYLAAGPFALQALNQVLCQETLCDVLIILGCDTLVT